MAIFTEQKAKELLTKVISFSTADECECNLDGSNAGNIRYARNTVSTAGEVSDVTLAVQSGFGKRIGVATINEFDDESLKKVVKRSEELANCLCVKLPLVICAVVVLLVSSSRLLGPGLIFRRQIRY